MKKCALITGASGGIGSEIALRLANDGFEIAACYNSDENGIKELEKKLLQTGVRFKIYKADVTDFNTIKDVFADATDFFGGVSVLVNNAGIAQQKLFTDITQEDFDRITAVNFKGVFNCCQCAVPFMVSQKSGKIINISSMWGVYGASCETVYSATKAAVIGLSKALARELAPSNIQVNCVAPGAIDTKMNNNLSEADKADFANEIPMGRFGTPAEIAGVVSFLASKDSDYVTAQVITADGGLT
ncbi:MAG: 3-oxoacyl-ACP reductase FabG [Clostridia bacterium]|nr:3-oxoacyl-ACP reductase FabG [Clostridia bacterium]